MAKQSLDAKSPSNIPLRVIKMAVNSKDPPQIKLIKLKLQEIDATCTAMKNDMAALNTKEVQDKLAEIILTIDKKANILDLKKLYGALDDSNSRFEDVKKEVSGLHKAIKDLEENEELKGLKLKFASLESKLAIGLKNIKDLQGKMAETMTLQIMPQSQQNNDEEKKDDKMTQFMEEIGDRVSKLRDEITKFKADFNNLTKNVEEKIETKSTKESLVDLESKLGCKNVLDKIYKEIDKVVSTLTKRFSDKPESKRGIKALEIQVDKYVEKNE